VSLINEALRKARQAASEHESKQPTGPFQPAKAYPSRRSGRRGGPLAMALIAVAAAAVGAVAVWWYLGDHGTASTGTAIVDGPSFEAATPPAPPAESPTPVDERATAVLPEALPQHTPVPAKVEQTVTESAPAVPVTEESDTDSDGNRVFVLEANLGYASLNLGYIVSRSTNPFAEINGREVRIGSEIQGFVVEAIEADRVVLRDKKGPLILRVP
jgi:hypothetical protein